MQVQFQLGLLVNIVHFYGYSKCNLHIDVSEMLLVIKLRLPNKEDF